MSAIILNKFLFRQIFVDLKLEKILNERSIFDRFEISVCNKFLAELFKRKSFQILF